MTKRIDILLFDGHDRTGKDSIADMFDRRDIAHRITTGNGYRDASRIIFGQNKGLAEDISQSMAKVEFMQLHDTVYREFVENGVDTFVLPRSFLSSMAYDLFRGCMIDRNLAVIDDLNRTLSERFNEENVELRFHAIFFHADIISMMERGSDVTSFEIMNHVKIDRSFDSVNNLIPFTRIFFGRRAEWVYTQGRTLEDVYNSVLQTFKSMV
jgi:hypothetical protein